MLEGRSTIPQKYAARIEHERIKQRLAFIPANATASAITNSFWKNFRYKAVNIP